MVSIIEIGAGPRSGLAGLSPNATARAHPATRVLLSPVLQLAADEGLRRAAASDPRDDRGAKGQRRVEMLRAVLPGLIIGRGSDDAVRVPQRRSVQIALIDGRLQKRYGRLRRAEECRVFITGSPRRLY